MNTQTDQTSRNSPSTENHPTAEAGQVFVDPAAAEGKRYHPDEEHTLDDELAEMGKAFPQVAELLRAAIKYLV